MKRKGSTLSPGKGRGARKPCLYVRTDGRQVLDVRKNGPGKKKVLLLYLPKEKRTRPDTVRSAKEAGRAATSKDPQSSIPGIKTLPEKGPKTGAVRNTKQQAKIVAEIKRRTGNTRTTYLPHPNKRKVRGDGPD